MIGLTLTGFVALTLVAIGVGALFAPRASSQQYGILLDDARALAFVRAMGVRDLVIGVLLALLLVGGSRDLLALAVAVSTAVAVVDYVVVTRDGRASRSARLLHGAGALGLLVAAALVALGL